MEMRLKIKGNEFIYEGLTRLIFDEEGKVKQHRDYLDFCSGTFGNLHVIGGLFRGYTQDSLTKTIKIKRSNYEIALQLIIFIVSL